MLYDNQGELVKTIPFSDNNYLDEGYLQKVEGAEFSNYVQIYYEQNILCLINEQGDLIKADTFQRPSGNHGKNGERMEYTYYGDKLLLNKGASAIRELKEYIIVRDSDYSYVFTKTGKKVYKSEKDERIRDLILEEQLYVYVKQGNYRGLRI